MSDEPSNTVDGKDPHQGAPVLLSARKLTRAQASDLLLRVARGQDDFAAGEAMKVLRTALLLLEQLGIVEVEGP